MCVCVLCVCVCVLCDFVPVAGQPLSTDEYAVAGIPEGRSCGQTQKKKL